MDSHLVSHHTIYLIRGPVLYTVIKFPNILLFPIQLGSNFAPKEYALIFENFIKKYFFVGFIGDV